MGKRKVYKNYGVRIEECIYYIGYLLKSSNSNVCEKNASLHILETNIKELCNNEDNIFSQNEVVVLREKLASILECEVNSKFNRELASLLNKLELMYKKIPFLYHGVMFGRLKLNIYSCLLVCAVLIASGVCVLFF